MNQRILIVGASLGGLRAAEQVVAAGFEGDITVVGDESHLPYNRPPLSKEALASNISHDELAFRRKPALGGVNWKLGNPATALDLGAQEVALADGSRLGFDGLIVATGVRARRLSPEQSACIPESGAGRHAIRTLDDAAALKAELSAGTRVVIIGAGFIGCEAAATAIGLGCEVTVVAPESVPMQRPLGDQVGAAIQRHHEAAGVRFHLGVLPQELLASEGRVAGVRLADGTELAADVVIEAMGSIPNTEWLLGIDAADGVRCTNDLQVYSADGDVLPNVVAVGDVARFPNPLFDAEARRVEHWNIPGDTAKRAVPVLVEHLAGTLNERPEFRPMPAFWSDQYDLRLQSFGSLALADDVQIVAGEESGEFIAAYLRGETLVGVLGVGMLKQLMPLRAKVGQPWEGVPA